MDYRQVSNWQKLPCLQNLLDLSTPPKQLYYCGKWNPEIFENCAAVVGSRKITDYGQRAAEKVIVNLVSRGMTVVSGFMYGVDQYAHHACCNQGGKTVAVLGWGIKTKLTGEDLKLAQKIISSGGLLLSEWEDQKASHWTFPARNRIVAALSKEIVVIEAAQNSGSLITARLALRLKRKLWAVPGPITSRTSVGTNNLIAEGLAQMWLGGEAPLNLIQTDNPILQILENESFSADEVARKLNLPVSEIGSELSLLLLSGIVSEKGGKYFLTDVS